MRQGEHTQFYKTHTAGPPFATFVTEIFICILTFKWDAAGITILRGGNGGILPLKIVKKYEFSMAYFSFKVSISTAGKTLKHVQSKQGVNYI